MKIKDAPKHGEPGHFHDGGCEGYAKGGRIEQHMEARARNREELGLPATESGLSTLADQIPGIGLINKANKVMDVRSRLANPELLHNTAGKALETNLQRGGPNDTFGREADVQAFSHGGEVEDTKDPSEIPEDVLEYIESAHKAIRESRPDEGWRIAPMEKKDSIAPYKREDEENDKGWMDLPDSVREEGPGSSDLPNFAEGGIVSPFDIDGGDSGTVKMGGQLPPMPAPEDDPEKAPTDEGPGPNEIPQAAPKPIVPSETMPAAPAGPQLTDQDFVNKANRMLGLNPEEQAGFMKLLGNNAQNAQIGAGIAGIGDAIASGGTLGKVNPGALHNAEEQIQGRTREGIEGMQTIRGNQEKATEMADKLESRDPQSPLSKWAQKAYAPVGKKIGLSLGNASASLIGDVTGKGVEALNTEYQNQLKMMGLDLQKKQVEATIGNQKAERAATKEQHQIEATKTLADRGIVKRGLDAITGNDATKSLERISKGQESVGPFGAETVKDGKAYEWSPETGKYHLKR